MVMGFVGTFQLYVIGFERADEKTPQNGKKVCSPWGNLQNFAVASQVFVCATMFQNHLDLVLLYPSPKKV